jgi:hypothetical protein
MTPAWGALCEALRHDGLDIGCGQQGPAEGVQLLINEHVAVWLVELQREQRVCLLWGCGDASEQQDPHAWIQHQRTDPDGSVWTTASRAQPEARIMASSIPAHGLDSVTIRTWFGHCLDWVATTSE